MLVCKNINYKISQKDILSNINFTLKRNQNLLILGESGCGKTTLLCILAGLLTPTAGSIKYDNIDLYKLSRIKRDQFRGLNLGIIFQNFHLIKSLNIFQNIALSLSFTNQKIDKDLIYSYLEKLGLAEKAKQNISSLSIGEKQRVAIIRSFICKPKYIFCDEPTSALDDKNTEKIINLLKEESLQAKSSLILITHDNRLKSLFKDEQILHLK